MCDCKLCTRRLFSRTFGKDSAAFLCVSNYLLGSKCAVIASISSSHLQPNPQLFFFFYQWEPFLMQIQFPVGSSLVKANLPSRLERCLFETCSCTDRLPQRAESKPPHSTLVKFLLIPCFEIGFEASLSFFFPRQKEQTEGTYFFPPC